MLEQLKYENHLGEILSFGDFEGLYVNSNELHDFKWDVISVADRISGFERGIQERRIPIRVLSADKEQAMALRNSLFEIPEKDVLRNQYGKLWVNDYYCECFVTSSTKSRYTIDGQYMACDLVITTDKPYWVKEVNTSFHKSSDSEETSLDLDYPHDYPHDYKMTAFEKNEIDNTGFFYSKFRMTILGSAINPSIYIGEHLYQVNVELNDGDVLTIDSNEKTVRLLRAGGSEENAFDYRDRDSYIFEDIPSGKSKLLWDGSFSFTVTLLEERSEPRWELPTSESESDSEEEVYE